MNELTNWCTHSGENYSTIIKNEPLIHTLTHATTQMNPADITLNKRTQTQKSTYHMISLIKFIKGKISNRNHQLPRDRGKCG